MSQRGHTLTELLVAVAVVIALLVGASGIFGAVTRVNALGEATTEVLRDAAALQRRLRADLGALSPEGFFAVRCVAVPNAVNTPGPLLDPALPPEAVIRADQLVFFTHGVHSIQTYRAGAGTNRKAQSTVARVYYGHAFQVPRGPAAEHPDDDAVWAIDPAHTADNPLVPWSAGERLFVRTRFQRNAGDPPGDYVVDGDFGPVDATQPRAARWLLARQAVLLASDGGSPNVFLFTLNRGGFRSTAAITDAAIRNGRVDAAAGRLGEVRRGILDPGGDGRADPWLDQRAAISETVFHPRAERQAPGMHRVDQALTGHVLAGACSSFIVDWTYDDGVGAHDPSRGVFVDPASEQPWFGLDPAGEPGRSRGVETFRQYVLGQDEDLRPQTVSPEVVEELGNSLTTPAGKAIAETGAVVYEALFGYDRETSRDPQTYTPWPSAVRITAVLHDAAGRLEAGREFQFVVQLPRR